MMKLDMKEKKVGYFLLIAGIILMVFAAVQMVLIFTGNVKPVNYISGVTQANSSDKENNEGEDPLSNLVLGNLLGGENGSMTPQIIDTKMIENSLNIMIQYFIMQFILSFGYKIANLGSSLIRPINVVVKGGRIEKEIESQESLQSQ